MELMATRGNCRPWWSGHNIALFRKVRSKLGVIGQGFARELGLFQRDKVIDQNGRIGLQRFEGHAVPQRWTGLNRRKTHAVVGEHLTVLTPSVPRVLPMRNARDHAVRKTNSRRLDILGRIRMRVKAVKFGRASSITPTRLRYPLLNLRRMRERSDLLKGQLRGLLSLLDSTRTVMRSVVSQGRETVASVGRVFPFVSVGRRDKVGASKRLGAHNDFGPLLDIFLARKGLIGFNGMVLVADEVALRVRKVVNAGTCYVDGTEAVLRGKRMMYVVDVSALGIPCLIAADGRHLVLIQGEGGLTKVQV